MLFALNESGKETHASSAERFRSYYCCECKKPVSLRAYGKWARCQPYFAHKQHVADSSCYLYVEGNYDPWAVRIPSKSTEALATKNRVSERSVTKDTLGIKARLRLKIESELPILTLELKLPRPIRRFTGSIIVRGREELPLQFGNIQGFHKGIVVLSDFGKECIFPEGDVDQEILEVLQSTVPSLSRDGINIFHDPKNSGLFLDGTETLFQGDTYAVLTKELDPKHLNLPTINNHGDYQGYQLFTFSLPTDLSEEKKSILESLLRRRIGGRRIKLMIASPLPKSIDSDGTIYVDPNVTFLYLSFEKLVDIEYSLIDGVTAENSLDISNNFLRINIESCNGVEIFYQKTLILRFEKYYGESFYGGCINATLLNSSGSLYSLNQSEIAIGKSLSLKIPPMLQRLLKIRHYGNLKAETSTEIVIEDGLEVSVGPFGYFSVFKEFPKELPKIVTNLTHINSNSLDRLSIASALVSRDIRLRRFGTKTVLFDKTILRRL